jgi:hypothetical protein
MIWFFSRAGRHLRCEVRNAMDGDRYELVITEPDGTERFESFITSHALNRRAQELGDAWMRDGWTGPHMRFL